jgi:hypothetical protein
MNDTIDDGYRWRLSNAIQVDRSNDQPTPVKLTQDLGTGDEELDRDMIHAMNSLEPRLSRHSRFDQAAATAAAGAGLPPRTPSQQIVLAKGEEDERCRACIVS